MNQPNFAYIIYKLYRDNGMTPRAAIAWERLPYVQSVHPEKSYKSTAAETTENCIRLFQVNDNLWIAMCGRDGICDWQTIPFFHASGPTPHDAYNALYREVRMNRYNSSEGIDLLFLAMNWL